MKVKFYLLSMWLFFVIVAILSLPPFWDNAKQVIWYEYILPIMAMVGLSYVSVFFLLLILKKKKDSHRLSVKVKKVENRSYDTLAFLASYFIPLVSFNLVTFQHQLVLVILFVAIGVIYVQSGMYYANPSLALLGVKTYTADVTFQDGTEKTGIVIMSRDDITVNDNITYTEVENTVYYVKIL